MGAPPLGLRGRPQGQSLSSHSPHTGRQRPCHMPWQLLARPCSALHSSGIAAASARRAAILCQQADRLHPAACFLLLLCCQRLSPTVPTNVSLLPLIVYPRPEAAAGQGQVSSAVHSDPGSVTETCTHSTLPIEILIPRQSSVLPPTTRLVRAITGGVTSLELLARDLSCWCWCVCGCFCFHSIEVSHAHHPLGSQGAYACMWNRHHHNRDRVQVVSKASRGAKVQRSHWKWSQKNM